VRRLLATLGLCCLVAASAAAPGQAAPAPRYDIKAVWGDTNLGAPDADGKHEHMGQFVVTVRNIGTTTSEEPFTVSDQLPKGVSVDAITWNHIKTKGPTLDLSGDCSSEETAVEVETVTCAIPPGEGFLVPEMAPAPGANRGVIANPSGYVAPVYIDVSVKSGLSGTGTNVATFSGGGAAAPVSDTDQVPLAEVPAPFGVVPGSYLADVFDAEYPAGQPVRQAGDRPFEFRFDFDLDEKTGTDPDDGTRYSVATGLLRDAEVTLPRGVMGNPVATPRCAQDVFAQVGSTSSSTACPADTQVGYLRASFNSGTQSNGRGPLDPDFLSRVAIYNLDPPKGQLADFGFNAGGFVQGHIYPNLDPAHDYAITTLTPNISGGARVKGTEVTFWGVPGDPAHDKFRFFPHPTEDEKALGASWGSSPIRPLLTAPVDCGFENGGARARFDSYQNPGQFTPLEEYGSPLDVSGCDDSRFRFKPQISLQPTDSHAGAPTGLEVHLEVPLRSDEVGDAKQLYAANGDIEGIPTPPLKKAVVTLPEGMTLNPSAAQGLETCTSQQIGIGDNSPVECPTASQYGTLTLHTPTLPADEQPEGFIYVAKQGDNPFKDFVALYLVIEDTARGLRVKVPGSVKLDPKTGQIATTFDDIPQFPVSDVQMSFNGGLRAALVNPQTCGKKTIEAELFSWQEPNSPRLVESSYNVTQNPDGSPCVNSLGERPFRPSLDAGTTNNTAGSYSPFAFRLTRSDADQEFSQIGLTLPSGLAAKFAGVGTCSDGQIARAEARMEAGEGLLEQISPSCPATSMVGETEVGTGVGVPLTYVPGKVYLGGPYRGAPLSVVAISPAVVGPFDAGVVVVRTALQVNHETAQGEATSDPLPQIIHGIPVRIRDVRFNLNRSGFTLNPTSCAEKQISAHVTGTGADAASAADDTAASLETRFQAADCSALGFSPKLAFQLFGGTHRGAFPKLKATVTYPKRGAYSNIGAAQVTLPHSEFIENAHFNTICTRVQFAAKACPAGSVYGHAVAKTPLFDRPLEGPVYLRSSTHQLPDVVAALSGPPSQPVEVDLDGQVDSVNGGIRNTFKLVPDAPVERFTITLLGGRKGLFVNSTNLCARTHRALAKFTAQNGTRLTERPVMQIACKSAGKKRGRR